MMRKTLNLVDRPHPHHFGDKELMTLASRAGFTITNHLVRRVRLKRAILPNPALPQSGYVKYLLAAALLRIEHTAYLCMNAE